MRSIPASTNPWSCTPPKPAPVLGRASGTRTTWITIFLSLPAPADAAASCSCDISYVYYRHATADGGGKVCSWRVANGTATTDLDKDKCTCCAASEVVSAFYNTCPGTAPDSVPFWDTTVGDSLSTLRSAKCRAALDSGFDCHKLGFAKPGIKGGSFYNDQTLPSNGTATISNVAGNAITSPVAGPTVVWKLGGADRFANVTAIAAESGGDQCGLRHHHGRRRKPDHEHPEQRGGPDWKAWHVDDAGRNWGYPEFIAPVAFPIRRGLYDERAIAVDPSACLYIL